MSFSDHGFTQESEPGDHPGLLSIPIARGLAPVGREDVVALAEGIEGANPFERTVSEADGVPGQLTVAGHRIDFDVAVQVLREQVYGAAMPHLPENPCVFRGNRTLTGPNLENLGPRKFDLLCAAISRALHSRVAHALIQARRASE